MKKGTLIMFLLILLFTLGVGRKIKALETTWPTSPFGTDLNSICTPIDNPDCTLSILIKYFYEWGIFLGGLAVLISLIFGGFLYLTSAGNPARLREAKDRIFSALIGLVLLLSIYLILNTINPELTTLVPPSFEPPEMPSVTVEGWEDTEKSCSYVRVYAETGWKGTSTEIWSEEDPDWDSTFHGNSDFPDGAKSARFFRECEDNESCINGKLAISINGETQTTTIVCEITNGECYKEGGLCTMELSYWVFAWFGLEQHCSDKIGSTNTSSPNLTLHLEQDRKIECVRVVKTGS
jgi:hypothetical protein